jgi:PP-loop superfamily ATP-utilizing enzyme
LDQVVQPDIRETLTQSIKSLGYLYVTLDLMGYQRGSLNSARQTSSAQPFS